MRNGLASVVMSVLLLGTASVATAGAPFTLSYMGRLADGNDKAVEGPVDLELKFYRKASGGSPLNVGPLTFSGVKLVDGVFQLDIKQLSDADLHTVFSDSAAAWIEVKDMTNNVVYPRQTLTAVPFALKVPVDGTTVKYNSIGQLEAVGGGSLSGGGDMSKSTYDGAGGTVADVVDNSEKLNGQSASYYLNASNIASGTLDQARIDTAIARTSQLPTAAAIATGFASDAVSGDKVHGGTISNFASIGIDDNADALAVTISAAEKVGIGNPTPDEALDVVGNVRMSGQVKIEGGSPAVGKVLVSDAGGLATWQSLPAGSSLSAPDGSPAQAVEVSNNGEVAIGGTPVAFTKLSVLGNVADSHGIGIFNSNTAGYESIDLGESAAWIGASFRYFNQSYVPSGLLTPLTSVLSGANSGGLLLHASHIAGSMRFATGGNANPGNVRMTITNDGKVGIGPNAPTGILDVQGGSTAAGPGAKITLKAQDSTLASSNGGDILLIPGAPGSGGSAGKVGIGISTPETTLDVNGSVRFKSRTEAVASVSVLPTDFLVEMTAASVTISSGMASCKPGRMLVLVKHGTGTVTFSESAATVFVTGTAPTLPTHLSKVQLLCLSGGKWLEI